RMSTAQRRAALRHDPLAQEVEPHRVHCRGCQKWIKLSTISEYTLNNWQIHKHRCPDSPPGSRVATAERKILLLNDPQVLKVCSPGQVECCNCKRVVPLEGEVGYDLTKWIEHKQNCKPCVRSTPRAFPPPSASSTHSKVSAGRSARSPTSAGEGSSRNSTETAVVTESSPAAVKVGVKRGREEETEDEQVADEPQTNRPRTETYKPPKQDAPSLFGWLMQPLKEFARGFREGLGST
ncbi:hypothetical protein HD554DRAFT_2026280, partial [Boletus coccyginus]